MSAMSASVTTSPPNSSGMIVQVALAALPMPSVRWPGRPPHGHAEIPAAGGLRVLHQALDHADADVTRRLVAERRHRQRHAEVVVDALRHLHDADAGPRGDRRRAAHHVVAADADERVDLELAERRDGVVEALRALGDVAPRRAEEDAAVEVDARHLVDRQLVLLVGVALRQPLEAVGEADGHAADADRLDGDRADHAVGAGRGTAADDDADAFDGHARTRTRTPVILRRPRRGIRTVAGTRRARGAPPRRGRSTQAAWSKSSASRRIM